jgi:7-cyano-7-deazaguanine synthase
MESNKIKVLVVNSGGMDSTTAVYDALDQGAEVDTISFNYGQRHSKELEYATRTAEKLGLRHDVVDLHSITGLLAESGSSLVSEEEVPEGHYAEDNMAKTVVPNRNMIMLAVAGGAAVARGSKFIVTGVHSGDHAIYPDCRPAFINHLADALVQGNEGFGDMRGILAPFLHQTKAQIARRAILLGMPFEETWSCYKGEDKHCGRCGTCVERLEAIHEAQQMLLDEGNPIVADFKDKTEYADDNYWKTVTNA